MKCSVVRLRTRFYFWLLRSFTCSQRLRPAATTCSPALAFIQSAPRRHGCVRLRLRSGFLPLRQNLIKPSFFLIYFPEGLGQTRMFLSMQHLQPCSACFLFPRRWLSEAGPSEAAVSVGATCSWMSRCVPLKLVRSLDQNPAQKF